MKILYLSSPAYVDTDVPLLKALVESGNDIMYLISVGDRTRSTLISLDENHDDVGIYKWSEYNKTFEFISSYVGLDSIYTIRRKNRKSFIEARKICLLLQGVVDEFQPDVIHQIDLPYYNMIPFVLKNKRRFVLTIHDPIPHIGEYNWKLELSRKIVFPFVEKIIILNEKSKNEFIENYRVAKNKVYISRLGFLDFMSDFVSDSQSSDYILFYGRITPYKGIEYLLKAMQYVHDKYPNIRLIIAGSGKYYFDKSEFESLGYISFVNRFIELRELADLIKKSKFVVCPYTEATQSGVVASVLALDTPIIVTNVGALSDMVEDSVTGLVIPPNDVIAISVAINKLLSDDVVLRNMSKAIESQKIDGKYSWRKIASLTERIYKS